MKLKAWVSFVLVGLGAAVLGGCPIYPDSQGHRVCLQSGECFTCPNDYYSGDCYSYSCSSDYDCPSGTSCQYNGQYGTCVGGTYTPDATAPGNPCSRPSDCAPGSNCGADDQCHAGDCSNTGCPSGYQCKLSGGTLACVPLGFIPDAGPSRDASSDGSTPFTGCHNDAECAAKTPGAKCLDGTCVPPADQCFDTTQCPANEQCVQGVCTPGCGPTTPCPTGFTCDSKTNVCSGNGAPCGATADGGTCTAGTVCVEDHCVPPCGPNNLCPVGEVCVAGGCIPDQKPQFTCAQEGVVGPPCAAGSVCIHHSCYIACSNVDGGTTCKAADKFNLCKPVTTSTGTYSVCGSATNLGSECDPTQGKLCTGAGVCIDGFCR